MRGEGAGQAMTDQDCRTPPAGDGSVEPREPGRKFWCIPVILQDACRIAKGETPIGLPVLDTGISEAGQD